MIAADGPSIPQYARQYDRRLCYSASAEWAEDEKISCNPRGIGILSSHRDNQTLHTLIDCAERTSVTSRDVTWRSACQRPLYVYAIYYYQHFFSHTLNSGASYWGTGDFIFMTTSAIWGDNDVIQRRFDSRPIRLRHTSEGQSRSLGVELTASLRKIDMPLICTFMNTYLNVS